MATRLEYLLRTLAEQLALLATDYELESTSAMQTRRRKLNVEETVVATLPARALTTGAAA